MEAEDDTGTLQQLKASLQMELQHAESSMRSDKSGRSSEQGGGEDDDGYGSSDFEEEEEIARYHTEVNCPHIVQMIID